VRRDLDVDPEAERAAEEEPRLGPIVVPGDGDLLAVRDEPHLDGVRVVARRAVALLDDVDARARRDHGRVDDVHHLVDALLEDAVQRRGGEERVSYSDSGPCARR
jgi:hypothetical protein